MRPSFTERPRRRRPAFAPLLICSLLVGCGTLSVPDERELGQEIRRQARAELDFVRDRVVRDYVREIGDAVVSAAGPQPFDVTFDVIEDEQVNAFAAPGGYIYVQTGLILNARNVSELAGVIAHEVGHVVNRHVAQNVNRARATGMLRQVGVLAALFLSGGRLANAVDLLGGIAGLAYLNTFTREAETEADTFAVEVLPQAGYDPRGMVSFFQTLQSLDKGSVPEFLRSHPTTEKRIAAAEAAIQAHPHPENLRVHDNGKLEIIQRRIRLLIGEE